MINRIKCLKPIPKDNLIRYYKVTETLYETSFGKVHKVLKRNDESNKHFIIKEIPLRNADISHVNKEFINLRNIPENIGPKAHKLVETGGPKSRYQMLLDYEEGLDLYEYFDRFQNSSINIPKENVREIIFNILLKINTLNQHNFSHLDLKLENIILKKPDNSMVYPVKLIDFGSSYEFKGESLKNIDNLIGTNYYSSPELNKKLITKKSDIWSLGVIAHVLLYYRYPYKEGITSYNYKYLKSSDMDIYDSKDFSCSSNKFVRDCLVFDWEKRPSPSQLLKHEWFKELL